MVKKILLVAIGLVVGLAGGWLLRMPAGPASGPPALPDPARAGSGEGKVVARAGDYEVTEAELRHRWENVLDAGTRDFHRDRGGPKHYLEEVLEEKMLSQEAAARGYPERPEVRSDLAMTLDLLASRPLLRDEVHLKAFPEERLRQYFEAHPEEFQEGERVLARHIVVTPEPFAPGQRVRNRTGDDATSPQEARRKIAFLQEKLDAGEDFAQLARDYSEDATAPAGGALGYVRRGRMLPQFEIAVFSLEPGVVSEPIETRVGLHLILVEEHRPGGPIPFEDARPGIVDRLLETEPEAAGRRHKAYIGELEEKYPVEVLVDEAWLEALDRH